MGIIYRAVDLFEKIKKEFFQTKINNDNIEQFLKKLFYKKFIENIKEFYFAIYEINDKKEQYRLKRELANKISWLLQQILVVVASSEPTDSINTNIIKSFINKIVPFFTIPLNNEEDFIYEQDKPLFKELQNTYNKIYLIIEKKKEYSKKDIKAIIEKILGYEKLKRKQPIGNIVKTIEQAKQKYEKSKFIDIKKPKFKHLYQEVIETYFPEKNRLVFMENIAKKIMGEEIANDSEINSVISKLPYMNVFSVSKPELKEKIKKYFKYELPIVQIFRLEPLKNFLIEKINDRISVYYPEIKNNIINELQINPPEKNTVLSQKMIFNAVLSFVLSKILLSSKNFNFLKRYFYEKNLDNTKDISDYETLYLNINKLHKINISCDLLPDIISILLLIFYKNQKQLIDKFSVGSGIIVNSILKLNSNLKKYIHDSQLRTYKELSDSIKLNIENIDAKIKEKNENLDIIENNFDEYNYNSINELNNYN